jgi:hypothetical protein
MTAVAPKLRQSQYSNDRPALVAVERGDLAVDKVLVDLAGELRQFVLEIDDLVQPRSKQIA